LRWKLHIGTIHSAKEGGRGQKGDEKTFENQRRQEKGGKKEISWPVRDEQLPGGEREGKRNKGIAASASKRGQRTKPRESLLGESNLILTNKVCSALLLREMYFWRVGGRDRKLQVWGKGRTGVSTIREIHLSWASEGGGEGSVINVGGTGNEAISRKNNEKAKYRLTGKGGL